ncbi:MAG: enoyl-CoA hydratase/isomerase family protein [Phycisphaeraceae bacterium]|nr:enoyl-CoA hydratase/isomerase family protein [Phycisphaeraceae bacterium]
MSNVLPLPFEKGSDGFATLTLEQPGKPVVVLDLELLQRLEASLSTLAGAEGRGIRGMIVRSASERVFVAGADLKTISEWSDDQLDRYLAFGQKVFSTLATLPFPTVAAINGAALGGGLELAMHCDALVAAPPALRDGQPGKPYPVGLPECSLGLCPGWGGTNLFPLCLDNPADAIRLCAEGKPMLFEEAVASGLFSEVAPTQAELLETAKKWLESAAAAAAVQNYSELDPWKRSPAQATKTLLSMDRMRAELTPTEESQVVLECLNTGLTKGYQAALDAERRHLVRLRHTPKAKQALQAFFARSK